MNEKFANIHPIEDRRNTHIVVSLMVMANLIIDQSQCWRD